MSLPVMNKDIETVEGKRCRGDCCERIPLSTSWQEIQDDYKRWQNDERTRFQDIELIATMLVPIGVSRLDTNGKPAKPHELFRCVHHDRSTGLCRIYAERPAMCREYPYGPRCERNRCASKPWYIRRFWWAIAGWAWAKWALAKVKPRWLRRSKKEELLAKSR